MDLKWEYCPAGATVELKEGISAYAAEQAALQRRLLASFKALWKTPLTDIDGLFKHETYAGYVDPDDPDDELESDHDEVDDTMAP